MKRLRPLRAARTRTFRHAATALLAVLCAGTGVGATPRVFNQAACTTPRATGALRLVVESFAGTPGVGRVRVVNGTAAAIRVWRAGMSWGDLPLSFQGQVGGRTVQLTWQGAYTRNVAVPVDVPAGCGYVIEFDLADPGWHHGPPSAPWVGPGATLTAVYNVPVDAESATYHVWTGRLQSAPAPWHP